DLPGSNEGRGGEGVRSVPQDLRGQVPESHRMPGQGSRGVADVLRFSGGALDAFTDDEPDRIGLRHRTTADLQDPRSWFSVGLRDDGLQTDGERRQTLAAAEWFQAATRGDRRCDIHRWRKRERRLIQDGVNNI